MIRYAFATSALTLATVAMAHAATDVVPVSERMGQDIAPLGVRAGSFLVIPKVDLDETYDDNIYATENSTKSDFVTKVKPEVAVKSNWSRHEVNALARGSFNRYADHDQENSDNYLVALDGRADVMRDTSVGGGIAYAQDHEDRGDPDAVASAVEPTEFETTTARVGAYRGLGRANARIDSEVKNFNFKNGFTNAGALVNNDLRDRTHYTQTLRLGYDLTPVFQPYVKGSVDSRVYDNKAPTNRSSHGNSVVAGTTIDLSGKTRADAFAGYARRNYQGALKDVSEPTYGLGLTWNVTDVTTILANIDRTIEETTSAGASSYLHSAYSAGVEHAFTRRWLGTAGLEFANNDYKGSTGTVRKDDVWTASVGSKYLINRCFSVGAEYRFRDRNSDAVNSDYSRNQVMVRLSATY